MLTLRPYQQNAKNAAYEHLRQRDDNPCIVLPTGAGKTPLMATICKDAVTLWNGRVAILAHVKELLEQSANKLQQVCPEVKFGIYSAGLRKRQTHESVIIAGIQSVYKKACDLGPFDLVLVDEAHLIQPDGEGMYRQFLTDAKVVNPNLRVIGLTATPYRLKSGWICGPDNILNEICYEVGVRELIVQGFLCPLVTKAGTTKFDTTQIHQRGGEFIASEVEDLMDAEELVQSACAEIVEATRDRNSVLIFCSGLHHAQHVRDVLEQRHGVDCGFVCGETSSQERDAVLSRFKSGELKYLCNVNVLTTGFDAPNVDCVALLRPTLSPGLYYQCVGRGFRLHPGKTNCLVLDFGGNVLRHGPVDAITIKQRDTGDGGGGEAPAKECPECHAVIAAGYSNCPECGYAFPPPEKAKHEAKASNVGILSGEVIDTVYDILDVKFAVHQRRGAGDDDPKTMRVDYRLGLSHWQSEWVCVEHTGYARQKAVAWWTRRSPDPVPETAEEAVALANAGALCLTEAITIRSVVGEKYDSIVGYQLGPMPEPVGSFGEPFNEDEVPF